MNPPKKIYFVHDELFADYIAPVAVRKGLEPLFRYLYSEKKNGAASTKLHKEVSLSIKEIERLARHACLKIIEP